MDIAMSVVSQVVERVHGGFGRHTAARHRRAANLTAVARLAGLLLCAAVLAAALVLARVAVYGHFQWGDPWSRAVPQEYAHGTR